jgi:DNA-binding response OmpR family regulator
MVVDDDPDAVAILSHYLRTEGFAPIEISSGAQCLRIAQREPPDLILMDLMMPEMDGLEVCRALKRSASTADIPVIVVTARDDLDARAQAMQLGVDEFVVKPVPRRHLITRIKAQLGARAATRATEEAAVRLAAIRRK